MSLSFEEQLLFDYFKMVSLSYCEETESVYHEIVTSSGICENSQKQLKTVLMSINAVIKKFDLEIVETVEEASSKKIHCLINTNNNAVAQKARFYDKQTCELLSKIIQECVTSESSSLPEISCLNITTSTKTNKTNLQTSLERLIKDKWLVSEHGKVSLGMRCQLELELTIKKQYPNFIKYCCLCKTFLMQGFTCQECESHMHLHCVKKFYEMNKLSASSNMCPICKEGSKSLKGHVEMTSPTEATVAPEPPAKKSRFHISHYEI